MNSIKNSIRGLLISVIAIALISCAPAMPLSPQDRQVVHKIKIDDDIDMPNGMVFSDNAIQVASSFGIIGAIASAQIADKDTRRIMLEEKGGHIDFENILLSELSKQLNDSKQFKVVNDHEDAVMKIKVVRYGLVSKGGFSSNIAPIVVIAGKLIRSDNMIWTHQVTVAPYNTALSAHNQADIAQNPDYLRGMWQAAAEIAVQRLLQTLTSSQ